MTPEQSLQFHALLRGYQDAADKFGLWTAAALMKESGCSDDGFMDFRAWLIAQGRGVYMEALKNPDSLAAVVKYADCNFERLSYVGDNVYEKLTGRSAYHDCTPEMKDEIKKELSEDIVYHPLIEYPLELPDAMTAYPRLGSMFMKMNDIGALSRHPMWNTTHPKIKTLVEKGQAEVNKFRKAKSGNREKAQKRTEPTR